MSGQTAVGTRAQAEQNRTDEPSGLRGVVADALGDADPVAVVYRENEGSLADPDERWHRFEAVEDLPEGRVDGWDELYAYTESHVYRWVGVGFNAGPERLPRDPSTLPAED